jgi:DNA-binding transcriptional LysR family regulator
MTDERGSARTPLRVAFVPGVTPDKWARTWRERMPRTTLRLLPVAEEEQLAVLDRGDADMVFLRVSAPLTRAGLSVIPLYREVPVVVLPVDHPVAALDEVSVADLSGEGLPVVPMSVGRLGHRPADGRDVTIRPVVDAADSGIALAWLAAGLDARIETFIGIVRGRTARSSRGR